MNELLSPQEIAELQEQIATVHEPRELIIEVLQAVQKNHGWVPDAGVELAAKLLGLSPLQVDEVATFYDKIYRSPVGRKVIHICDSICCWSRGAETVYSHLQQVLGIAPGETTSDGFFTLLPTSCLGACDKAPAMRIGEHLYGDLTVERVTAILADERQETEA